MAKLLERLALSRLALELLSGILLGPPRGPGPRSGH